MPRRTKACATCRQKRMKCDATMPHCIMCARFGRECPGVTDAPLLFIDNSAYPEGKKPRRNRNAEASSSHAQPRAGAEIVRYNAKTAAWRTDEASAGRGGAGGGLPEELAYVMLAHVSPRYVLNEAFFANLVGYFCAEGRHIPGTPRRTPSWLYALPRMASSASPSTAQVSTSAPNALGLALRATTAAFSGIETRNQGLMQYAYGLYGAALRAQGHVLVNKPVGMEIVGASVMLSMFEAVCATTAQAYAEHVVGASKMMDSLLSRLGDRGGGEARGRTDDPGFLLMHLFFHVRTQLAFVFLTAREDRIRADEYVRRVLMDACGWRRDELPLMQRLVGCIGALADIYFTQEAQGADQELYICAKTELDALWADYEPLIKQQRLCWTNTETRHTDFRDPFTSLNFAYFAAARILSSLVSERLPAAQTRTPPSSSSPASSTSSSSTPHRPSESAAAATPSSTTSATSITTTPPPSSQNSTTTATTTTHLPIRTPPSPPSTTSAPTTTTLSSPFPTTSYNTDRDAALILDAAWYLRLRDVGFSYLRLHVPLLLAARFAPREEQRRLARMIFEEWARGQLRGIGRLGLEGMGVEGMLGGE